MSTSANLEASGHRRCAACKHLRRRCSQDCILAPYFPAVHPQRYTYVHRIFGASNVARLLQHLPMEERGRAADAMAAEAYWRVQDPVYGCTGVINRLEQEIHATQCELARTQAQVALYMARPAQQVTGAHQLGLHTPQQQQRNDHSVGVQTQTPFLLGSPSQFPYNF